MASKLTAGQKLVLEYLRSRMNDGVPPTVREICAATGIKSTSSVHNHLRVLEELGYIERIPGANRSIRLTEDSRVAQVPLLGKVTAGVPILAYEDVVGYIPFPADRYYGSELFALRVCGESMKNAGILNEDIIIIERVPTAYNGQIVVALIGDEATVKRFYREKNGVIRLQPENESMEPIFSDEDTVKVLGRVVSCIRYYG